MTVLKVKLSKPSLIITGCLIIIIGFSCKQKTQAQYAVEITINSKTTDSVLMKSKVIAPLEKEILKIEHVSKISSLSEKSYGLIKVEFKPNINIDEATLNLQNRIQTVTINLPKDADVIISKIVENPKVVELKISLNNADSSSIDSTTMKTNIINPLVKQTLQIKGVHQALTSSKNGIGIIRLKFYPEISENEISSRVQQKLSEIKTYLPKKIKIEASKVWDESKKNKNN